MSQTEEMIARMIIDTDGSANFVRLNKVIAMQFACVSPLSYANIGFVLMVKCLVKVPKHYGEAKESPDDLDHGRWSYPLTTADIVSEINPINEFGGKESNYNTIIRALLNRRMFFRFTVKTGVFSSSIYTYNRYPFLNGIFWPEHRKNYKSSFSPPITPKIIATLTSQNSYHNAISRQSKHIHNKMRGHSNWKTLAQVKDNVKLAFCKSFIGDLLDGVCPEIRDRFVRYDDSGLSPDDYVKHIRDIAKSLPPYVGIDINETFLTNLKLPAYYIKYLTETIKPSTSDNLNNEGVVVDKKLPVQQLLDNSSPDDSQQLLDNSSGGVQQLLDNSSGGVQQLFGNCGFLAKTGDNTMTINGLQESDLSTIRILREEDKDIRIERNGQILILDSEKSDNEVLEDDLVDPEEVYNGNMNGELKDKSLTDEQQKELAFSSSEFLPDRRVKSIKAKTKTPDQEEQLVMTKAARESKSLSERRERKSHATILTSPKLFMGEFKKIVKSLVPQAKFFFGDYERLEYAKAQLAIDKLKEFGVKDDDVLRMWILHAARLNSKRTGFFGISMVLDSWDSFSKKLPTPEFVEMKRSQKMTSGTKKNPIQESMSNIFKGGMTISGVLTACQFWGVVMTAHYLAVTLGKQEALKLIFDCLSQRSKKDINIVFSVTSQYDSITSSLFLSDWKTHFHNLLVKAGDLDQTPITDTEKENAISFVANKEETKDDRK